MKRMLMSLLFLTLFLNLVSAATLKGTVYNTNLDPETNVLVKINTLPEQRLLSRDGNFQFTVVPGTYIITSQKSSIITTEEISITDNGEYVFDLFLFPDGTEEEDLWKETEQNLVGEETGTRSWFRMAIPVIIIFLLILVFWYFYQRKKNKKHPTKEESLDRKTEPRTEIKHHEKGLPLEAPKEHQASLEKTIEIIKQHDGRISQKDLRKEMMHLSEAKISLILTELEHKGKIEKIKKGRGNVVILK